MPFVKLIAGTLTCTDAMPGELLAEKPQEKPGGGDGESESKAKEAPAAKQMVGIIYPPPEVRSIPLLLSLLF